MTKADLISEITEKTGVEKIAVQATVESLMTSIIDAMESGENVYLRGFGSFVIKKGLKKQEEIFQKIQQLSFQSILFLLLSQQKLLLKELKIRLRNNKVFNNNLKD
jgi:DNA-binding protein HU-beta